MPGRRAGGYFTVGEVGASHLGSVDEDDHPVIRDHADCAGGDGGGVGDLEVPTELDRQGALARVSTLTSVPTEVPQPSTALPCRQEESSNPVVRQSAGGAAESYLHCHEAPAETGWAAVIPAGSAVVACASPDPDLRPSESTPTTE